MSYTCLNTDDYFYIILRDNSILKYEGSIVSSTSFVDIFNWLKASDKGGDIIELRFDNFLKFLDDNEFEKFLLIKDKEFQVCYTKSCTEVPVDLLDSQKSETN